MAAPTPRLLETTAAQSDWPRDRLEVRFESEEAFQRGLALARSDAGVTLCKADPDARRLVLRLETGEEPRTLH